nr:putative reverse transcriptase domain-containing protein [Tanacetum cinerariifolium]
LDISTEMIGNSEDKILMLAVVDNVHGIDMFQVHAVCVPFNFVESGRTTKSKNWSPQQPPQVHIGCGLMKGRFITSLLKCHIDTWKRAITLRVRLQPWQARDPATVFVNLSLICHVPSVDNIDYLRIHGLMSLIYCAYAFFTDVRILARQPHLDCGCSHAVCVPFNFVESGRTTERKNWSPQQPPQAITLRVRLQPWQARGPASYIGWASKWDGLELLGYKSNSFNFFKVGTGSMPTTVYGLSPWGPLDLLALPSKVRTHATAEEFVGRLAQIHQTTHAHLVAATAKYKEKADQKRHVVDFYVGDFVWAILTKDRFPAHEYNKLAAKKIGPVEIVEKINPNTYRLRLPSHVRTHDVFNVKHFVPFMGDSSDEDDAVLNSRLNLLYRRGNDSVQLEEVFMQKRGHPKLLQKLEDTMAPHNAPSQAWSLLANGEIKINGDAGVGNYGVAGLGFVIRYHTRAVLVAGSRRVNFVTSVVI